jgi:hypothetical protein
MALTVDESSSEDFEEGVGVEAEPGPETDPLPVPRKELTSLLPGTYNVQRRYAEEDEAQERLKEPPGKEKSVDYFVHGNIDDYLNRRGFKHVRK